MSLQVDKYYELRYDKDREENLKPYIWNIKS